MKKITLASLLAVTMCVTGAAFAEHRPEHTMAVEAPPTARELRLHIEPVNGRVHVAEIVRKNGDDFTSHKVNDFVLDTPYGPVTVRITVTPNDNCRPLCGDILEVIEIPLTLSASPKMIDIPEGEEGRIQLFPTVLG